MLNNFRTYQLAIQLHHHCKSVQANSSLKDQLTRATQSVVLNLAEGSAKPTAKDRRRYYAIALGSCREIQACLQLADNHEHFKLADQLGAYLYRLVHPTQ